jgi:hypothetical protein
MGSPWIALSLFRRARLIRCFVDETERLANRFADYLCRLMIENRLAAGDQGSGRMDHLSV